MPQELSPETLAKITQKLGLPPDADAATIDNRIEDVAGAGARVNRAIQSGKILASQSEFWLNAFKNDFRGTMAVLDSLAVPRMVAPIASASASAINDYTAPPVTEPQKTTTTIDEMNAQAYADPAFHRVAWGIGVRGGLVPPKQSITGTELGDTDDLFGG